MVTLCLCASLMMVCVHCVATPQLRKSLVRSCGYKFPRLTNDINSIVAAQLHISRIHTRRGLRDAEEREDSNNMKL